ncbi:HNH endonuclease [Lutibacter sp. B1]|uniref:HNH endonuclease n=1 Tax=Lutibacter sp. B1 TaxID=2725996 RepID=UPI0014565119|nr:HNH endonuclease [Lutibacter sp. B1]NLP59451.1 HNH endonuclease [Lutibacter sp. B1]
MTKRKAISKKIRFEVFKRDSFTCQYCGKKAPEIVLNIDHIEPVKEGGNNELFNLITSCFDCNNGKRARKLNDNSVLTKQRDQLEIIQQRKEQIELMLEWKKSLENVEVDYIQIIIDYINSKIKPNTLNENGKTNVVGWLKTFKVEEILEAIDISAEKNLKYYTEEIYQESIEIFMSKIGGILRGKRMKPIQQRIAYINGIGRNKMYDWENVTAKILLNKYTKLLENYGWEEIQILEYLDREIQPFTIESKNWTNWKNQIENWILNVNQWERDDEIEFNEFISENEEKISIDEKIILDFNFIQDNLQVLIFFGSLFPEFNENKFKTDYYELITSFFNFMRENYIKLIF